MGHFFLQPEQVHLCAGVLFFLTSSTDQSWGPAAFVGQLDSETNPAGAHTHTQHLTQRNTQTESDHVFCSVKKYLVLSSHGQTDMLVHIEGFHYILLNLSSLVTWCSVEVPALCQRSDFLILYIINNNVSNSSVRRDTHCSLLVWNSEEIIWY